MQIDHVRLQFRRRHKDDKELSVLPRSHLFWEGPKQRSAEISAAVNGKPTRLEMENPTAAIFLTFWL